MKKQFLKLLLCIIAVSGWFALVAQLYLIIINRVTPIPETIIRYFSFYTILTNILVAYCATVLLLKHSTTSYGFFSKQTTLASITVYITVVGLVYNLILRHLWNPAGLQMIVDELLHSFIPLLFLIFWFVFIPKHELKWKNILSWMIYPFVYSVFILIRGKISGFYPYPFMDINKSGLSKVLLNSFMILVLFTVLSFLFIWIGKLRKRSVAIRHK